MRQKPVVCTPCFSQTQNSFAMTCCNWENFSIVVEKLFLNHQNSVSRLKRSNGLTQSINRVDPKRVGGKWTDFSLFTFHSHSLLPSDRRNFWRQLARPLLWYIVHSMYSWSLLADTRHRLTQRRPEQNPT